MFSLRCLASSGWQGCCSVYVHEHAVALQVGYTSVDQAEHEGTWGAFLAFEPDYLLTFGSCYAAGPQRGCDLSARSAGLGAPSAALPAAARHVATLTAAPGRCCWHWALCGHGQPRYSWFASRWAGECARPLGLLGKAHCREFRVNLHRPAMVGSSSDTLGVGGLDSVLQDELYPCPAC